MDSSLLYLGRTDAALPDPVAAGVLPDAARHHPAAGLESACHPQHIDRMGTDCIIVLFLRLCQRLYRIFRSADLVNLAVAGSRQPVWRTCRPAHFCAIACPGRGTPGNYCRRERTRPGARPPDREQPVQLDTPERIFR